MLIGDDFQKIFVIDRDSKVFSESLKNIFAAAAVFTADGNENFLFEFHRGLLSRTHNI